MLRLGVLRAGLVTSAIALLTVVGAARLPGPSWLVPIFGAWLIMGWRGAIVWRGALGGLAAGLGALVLPTSVLRPCCATMSQATSCSMPEVCAAAGGVLGLVVAATLPRLRTPGQWARACVGALVAVAPLVACRCSTLFFGESVGLLGGLMGSAAAVALARSWWASRSALAA